MDKHFIKFPLNNLAYKRNLYFTGREKILENLRNALISGNCVKAILGAEGVGKTQLALEYIFRFGYSYDLIWWIRANNSLYEDYYRFARQKKLIDSKQNDMDIVINAVRNWMQRNSSWLFVFDNAENYEAMQKYLPSHVNGHIIITSSDMEWPNGVVKMELDTFTPEEAEDFLLKRTGLDDKKGASLLAEKLQYLPLPIEQAGAYININNKPFNEYIELLDQSMQNVLDWYRSDDYHYLVASTCSISLDEIIQEDSFQLMNLCSLLDPDHIPSSLFIEGNGKDSLPEPLATSVGKPEFQNIMAQLVSYSILNISDNILFMHRLTQEVVMRSLYEIDEIQIWCGYAVRLLYTAFSHDQKKYGKWLRSADLLPHAISVTKNCLQYDVGFLETAWLFNESGGYLTQLSKYGIAEKLYKKALYICEEILAPDHPDTANTLNNLALLYRIQGEYDKAEPLYNRALKIRRSALDEKHPSIATTLNYLALLYYHQGRYDEAEPLYKEALEIREEVLGPNHPYTASTLNNLAKMYESQAKYDKVESLYKRALDIYLEVLGEDHYYTANTINSLALLYKIQGRYDEAEPLYKRALDIRQRVLGPNHPSTATTLNYLALLYCNQGRYSEAEPLYKAALEIRQEVLGENHPYTVATLNNLAGLYESEGKFDEVESLYKKSLETYSLILNAEHPYTADLLCSLAGLYTRKGYYDKAESLYERALVIKKRVFGAYHPDTAATQTSLANVYANQDKLSEAEELYKSSLDIYDHIPLGSYSHDLTLALSGLAGLYESHGRYDEAEPLLKRTLEMKELSPGPDHTETAAALCNMAGLYDAQGKKDLAEQLYKRALDIYMRTENYAFTAATLNYLALMYIDQGRFDEAEPLFKRALEIYEQVLGSEQ